MILSGYGLKDLVNLEDWQKVQDSFSDVLGITIRTAHLNGKLLTEISGPSRLCSIIPPNNPNYEDLCGTSHLKNSVKNQIEINEEANFKTACDLDLFILPIRAFGKRIAAYMIIGPVILQKRKERREYVKFAKDLGIDLEKLMDALIEINVFSYNKIKSMVKLIGNIFSYMAQTGYHKRRLGEIAQEVTAMDPLFSTYYEEKILNALLNTCTLAFDADSGSVMTVDKNTNHLHIKVASRLHESIIHGTDIKMGEGIAGVAALTAEPIILPKDKNKNGLSKQMKRDYIKSSMIVPFAKPDNENVYGVISLNIVRKDRDFSEKDIALIKELINLASTALIPVK